MSQRSRSHASRRSSGYGAQRVPVWVWLFTGAVLGAFIMFLLRLSDVNVKPENTPPSTTTSSSKRDKANQKPRFDFYELLKETEIDVGQSESIPKETQANQAESNKAEHPSDTKLYLLQVASFKQQIDAESLRAQLLLLNFDATVQSAEIKPGDVWHRVMVGPFESRSKMAKARSGLASHDLPSLILRRPKSSG